MDVGEATTTALWLDQLPIRPRRPAVNGTIDCDVAIVGGGFSGLWTAYYLTKIAPELDIVVLEREFCGFGASGRNGGWCIGEMAGSFAAYAKRSSHAEAMRLEREVMAAVDEVGRVVATEGIDCGFAKGGTIRVARTTPQADRQRAEIDHMRELGFTAEETRLLSADEARTHLNATRVQSGILFGPSAALSPARLTQGLAERVEAGGVRIFEDTQVEQIDTDQVIVRSKGASRSSVRAATIIRATEAYTRDLNGERRTLLPVYSLMIATEPLSDDVFDEIGLHDRQTFADDRHMVIYGQRTDDNRLAFGGRGVPYLFGSRIASKAELHQPSHQLLQQTLVDLLPAVAKARITHRWGGVLGIPRDWVPGLRFDPTTRHGVLGGYVGEGVAAANLAGRTMADLVVGENTDRTSLPWVGVEARRWEPEPFRWIGVRASRRILAGADESEEQHDKPAKFALRMSRLLRGA